jgi:hypothetical protein
MMTRASSLFSARAAVMTFLLGPLNTEVMLRGSR